MQDVALIQSSTPLIFHLLKTARGRLKVDTIHIPLNKLRERLDELDKNQAYIVSCHSGLRSYIAERILKQAGFTVQNLDGAYSLYKMANPEGVEYGN